ncbi:SapC family protein [Halomonas campisalis]|uniref:SapC family protein n=1 Tax=Billgrantia campisalis TaxID=74661 RepID=A0ABS9PET3_9GAMM|nr:SapC family protein [Halomonas campisalis]MCG6659767.1 SapC family protein [Halomonas campisalis]MDR5865094.1 SapC family protein [Halomonas campisalis]
MSQFEPLDPERHLTHGWKRQDDYRFAAEDAWAPLLLAELPTALAVYPLAFAPRLRGGHRLVALQGLHQDKNLLVAPSGRWALGYVPSYYRGYPFSLNRVIAGGQERQLLCFDHASGLYRERPQTDQGEQRFFDDQGQPTPLVVKLFGFLKQCASNQALTDRAVDALEKAGLLTGWTLDVENPDPARPLLMGLKRIDDQALAALDGPTLAELRDAQALPIAYGQRFSTSRLGVLHKFAQLHAAHAARQTQATSTNLDGLFGEGDDDLEFDFDQ